MRSKRQPFAVLRASLPNDGSKTNLYNQANRLITVTASGLTWSAAYNGDGAPTTYTLDPSARFQQAHPIGLGQALPPPLATSLTECAILFDHSVIE